MHHVNDVKLVSCILDELTYVITYVIWIGKRDLPHKFHFDKQDKGVPSPQHCPGINQECTYVTNPRFSGGKTDLRNVKLLRSASRKNIITLRIQCQ